MTIILTLYIYNAQIVLQEVTTNVRFTFSLSYTTHVVYNQYRARQIESVTVNTIFSEHSGTCQDAIESPLQYAQISQDSKLQSNIKKDHTIL